MEGVTEARVQEIPAGGSLKPFKLGVDELVYVLNGRGFASVWGERGAKRDFEWSTLSAYIVPRHAWCQLNNMENKPVRLLFFNYLPLAMSVVSDPDFFFNNAEITTSPIDNADSEHCHHGGERMNVAVTVTVNGKTYQSEVEPRLLLVHYLRDVLGLTGTHVGCDTSQCGACTVVMNGVSVKSCTVFAVQAEDAEVLTVEGLARDGQLHPIQEGFWEEHGLQCGYCTPGMIMAAVDLLEENPDPTEDEVRHGLEGNLCRCPGYHNIVKAVRPAATEMQGA